MDDKNAERFLELKGQNIRVKYVRPVKMKKDKPQYLKEVIGVFCAGKKYDNQKSVQEKRESGELPPVNLGLPWGIWELFPYIISHKGKKYLRFYPATLKDKETQKSVSSKAQVRYLTFDGKEVSEDIVKKDAQASEFGKEEDFNCMTICSDHIIQIGKDD